MIWNLPVRLFHWSFAASIIASYVTGEQGNMFWHEIFGLFALGLLAFRLIWGIFGSHESRLAHLFYSPRDLFSYIQDIAKRRTVEYEKHNPTGALAVLVFFVLMGALAITGLWASDDVLYDAPFKILFPNFFTSATSWHIRLHSLVIPLIALHLFAILFHRLWLKEKLLTRMIGSGGDDYRQREGLLLLLVCVVGALLLALISPNY